MVVTSWPRAVSFMPLLPRLTCRCALGPCWEAVPIGRRTGKSDFNIFQNEWDRAPASMAGFTATCSIHQMSAYPEAIDGLPLDALATWKRLRQRKREQWTARYWRKNVAGEASLNADGYVTTVKAGTNAWCFEIRAIRTTEICQSGDGYRSSESARLAAFDAITDLLLKQAELRGCASTATQKL